MGFCRGKKIFAEEGGAGDGPRGRGGGSIFSPLPRWGGVNRRGDGIEALFKPGNGARLQTGLRVETARYQVVQKIGHWVTICRYMARRQGLRARISDSDQP